MRIEASLCNNCGKAVVPRREICQYCGRSAGAIQIVHLQPRGRILSYTVLMMPPIGFEPPVLLALVEIDKKAVVLCLGAKSEINRMRIGTEVTLDKDESGRFRFSLAS